MTGPGAWAANHTATISYRSASHANARTTDIDPYLLDHTQSGTYVFGYSSEHREVRSFKVDRILEVLVTQREFEPGDVEHIAEQLRRSWGGVVLGESTTKCRSTSRRLSRRASGRATGTRASSSTTSPAAEFACA
ncbi:MAG: WYL domain-containing protein [Dehalococcoidia bacterium]|nr:WYL domain-containing protein [Dehalococcoidia bacterium]